MEPKICPIMSRMFQSKGAYDQEVTDVGFIDCQREKCALWVSAWTNEGHGGQERGCAFAINAMKNSDGMVVV